MNVIEYRFLSPDEVFQDSSFDNWSRRYEWGYVLNYLRTYTRSLRPSIHNACCGTEEIHWKFQQSLIPLASSVLNTDIRRGSYTDKFKLFKEHNILDPFPQLFDIVLCISSLEELGGPEQVKKAYHNLMSQVLPGGDLIITCDYPDVDTKTLDDLLQAKIKDVDQRLSGANSLRPQPEYKHLNIILIHEKA